jgi:hypothetical protein
MEIEMDDIDRHLFVIGESVFRSLDEKTIESTADAMCELKIYAPPFKKIAVQIHSKPKDIFNWLNAKDIENAFSSMDVVNWSWKFDFDRVEYKSPYSYETTQWSKTLGFLSEQQVINLFFRNERIKTEKEALELLDSSRIFAGRILELLFVLLATKNIEKNTSEHKKYEKAIKAKISNVYKYTTVLRIGKITETCRSNNSTGATVRPHLRRGHIRTQHFGAGNKEIKKIFIQPVFVNADEGWIADQRKAYVVKAA